MRIFLLALLAGSLLFIGACSQTLVPRTVLAPCAPRDSDLYAEASTILVILETAEVYEMEDFAVRGDSLVGTKIIRVESGAKKGEEKISLALDEIDTIQVPRTSGRGEMFFATGAGFALLTAPLFALIILAIIGAADN